MLREKLKKYGGGFTLIETLVVIAIVGILSGIVLVSVGDLRERARDSRRKSEVARIGQFLTFSCYLPVGGEGEYDIITLAQEIITQNPQYSKFLSNIPKDPKVGSDTESKYIYTVDGGGEKCALYANLENPNEQATLSITSPAPGGGTGVLKADNPGWNDTPFYFQVSN